jgi:hypothetical protein
MVSLAEQFLLSGVHTMMAVTLPGLIVPFTPASITFGGMLGSDDGIDNERFVNSNNK